MKYYLRFPYAENSPNSICEAQFLGVPVISTMVGGISSLIRNKIDGELVPANDPWQLAYKIISLSNDVNKLIQYSKNSLEHSRKRHDPNRIITQLLNCYQDVLINRGNEKFKD